MDAVNFNQLGTSTRGKQLKRALNRTITGGKRYFRLYKKKSNLVSMIASYYIDQYVRCTRWGMLKKKKAQYDSLIDVMGKGRGPSTLLWPPSWLF